MNRNMRLIALSVLLPFALAACAGAAPSTGEPGSSSDQPVGVGAATGPTRESEGGQVTVDATWAGPNAGATFDVQLDTHSVDLDSLDLSNAVLRNDRGEILKARPWTAPKGGHHRSGTLTFEGDAAAFLAGAKSIELVLTGIGDMPQRTLRWEVAG